MRLRGRHLSRLVILAAMLCLLILPGGALADDSTGASGSATNPAPLTGAVQGQLAANSGGSFAYYAFAYPGDGSSVTLSLTVDNPVPLEQGAAGINAYLGGTLLASGTRSDITHADLTFSSPVAGKVLVQVFNYSGASAEQYTLVPTGLPGETTTTTTSSTATGSAASSIGVASTTSSSGSSVLQGAAAGMLRGSRGGSFAAYTYTVPAGATGAILTLTVDPAIIQENKAAGLNVYDGAGNLAATGQPTAPGEVTAVLAPASGTYTVQVFNYDPTTTIGYTLTASAT